MVYLINLTMLKRSGLVIFSLVYWLWFILTNIIFFAIALVIWIITVLFDKKLVILHQWASLWGYSYIWLNPLWPTRITGRRNIRCGKTYVIVSNHQSMLDILVLFGLFRHYKWVSKKENFRIPIIGWLMRLNRYIEIERGRIGSYAGLIKKISSCLQNGNSVLMFPEGTRQPGDKMGSFKDGAFRMALDNRAGIIPVILDGTAAAVPKGKIILPGRVKINVKILDEIPYDDFKGKKPKELTDEVRKIMLEEFRIMSSEERRAES
jgi:1-acyl-sn-glycerol-3-phosphate acyltransferase